MLNEQITREASEWFVNLRDAGDSALQERFLTWLRASPEHVRAYLGMVELWTDLPAVDAQRALDPQTLIARARAEGGIVALGLGARGESREENASCATTNCSSHAQNAPLAALRVRPALSSMRWPIAACVTVGLLAGVMAWVGTFNGSVYEAGIGEKRSLKLEDGSTVELNSRSRLRVRFSNAERNIDLMEGQALFQVARDAQRPFVVHSADTRVRAVGTAFDVYKQKERTIVTVVEGRVAVLSQEAATSTVPVPLAAGEQITVAARGTARPVPANVAAATAWRRGHLMFKSTPLSAVVDEFNRYNSQRLVLSEGIEDFPITAVFASTSPGALVEFLKAQPEFRVQPAGREIRIERAVRQGADPAPTARGTP